MKADHIKPVVQEDLEKINDSIKKETHNFLQISFIHLLSYVGVRRFELPTTRPPDAYSKPG